MIEAYVQPFTYRAFPDPDKAVKGLLNLAQCGLTYVVWEDGLGNYVLSNKNILFSDKDMIKLGNTYDTDEESFITDNGIEAKIITEDVYIAMKSKNNFIENA